jgi:hypothetical protein
VWRRALCSVIPVISTYPTALAHDWVGLGPVLASSTYTVPWPCKPGLQSKLSAITSVGAGASIHLRSCCIGKLASMHDASYGISAAILKLNPTTAKRMVGLQNS